MCLLNFTGFQVCMPACIRLLIQVSGVYACYIGIQVCNPAVQGSRCVILLYRDSGVHACYTGTVIQVCTPAYAGIQVCTPAFTGFQVCTSAYAGIKVCTPAYIGIFRCLRLHFYLCSGVYIYLLAKVFRCVQTTGIQVQACIYRY
jgi:hypothetical protein